MVPQEGGSALAQKLVDIYFSLFKLLLEGHLGNAATRQQQQEQVAGSKPGKGASHKKGGKKQRPPYKGRGSGGKDQDGSSSDKAAAGAAAGFESAQQAGELDARMLSALITGVRRAFPYVEADKVEPLVESHGEALFKLVHTAPFTVALQVSKCVV